MESRYSRTGDLEALDAVRDSDVEFSRSQIGLEAKVKPVEEVTETADVEPVEEEEQMQQEVSRNSSSLVCVSLKLCLTARTSHCRRSSSAKARPSKSKRT